MQVIITYVRRYKEPLICIDGSYKYGKNVKRKYIGHNKTKHCLKLDSSQDSILSRHTHKQTWTNTNKKKNRVIEKLKKIRRFFPWTLLFLRQHNMCIPRSNLLVSEKLCTHISHSWVLRFRFSHLKLFLNPYLTLSLMAGGLNWPHSTLTIARTKYQPNFWKINRLHM